MLYNCALLASRRVAFYENDGVPDTVDGRFDLLILHVWLLHRRLNQLDAQPLGQDVFDAMFVDMDNALRELGISDTRVGKRIKDMAKVFYDRAEVYNNALDKADPGALTDVVNRHFFKGVEPVAPICSRLAGYMQDTEQALAGQGVTDLLKSGPCYPSFA